MTWATKRKLTYFAIFFFVVLVLAGIPAYALLYKPPTCFDGKQNQKEDGVDCGGPCVKLCKPLELLPVTLWQQAFKVAPGVYSAVAYVQNPNINAEAYGVPYKFTLYDAKNIAIAERQGKIYIPPGQNFAVFEANIQTGLNDVVRTEFDFDSNFTWRAAKKKPALKIINLQADTSGSIPTVTADLQNSSYTSMGKLSVVAILYDTDGNAFAASRTFVDYLDAQSLQHVVFTWPLPFDKTVVRVEIIPIAQQ